MKLYELIGREGLRYSLYSWRSRLALAHKGLQEPELEFVPVLMHDKAGIAFSGGKTVPILVDGEVVVRDSWRIAAHLDAHHPGMSLLGADEAGRGATQLLCAWVDQALVPALAPMIAVDIAECIDPADVTHFTAQMEGYFGKTLAEAAATREQAAKGFRRALEPVRRTLGKRRFIAGAAPAYADIALFSMFQWARLTSAFDPLAADDAVLRAWREAMLDAYGGVARAHASAAK
jgi:glutathione S-transferase